MSSIDQKSKIQSGIITAVVGVLTLLLLFITISFHTKTEKKPLMIEIAMLQESNYGQSNVGQGAEEPKPAETASEKVPQEEMPKEVTTPAPKTPQKKATPLVQSKTQTTPKKVPQASETPKKKNTSSEKSKAPQGDARGKSALENILGGKGTANSQGQGNDGTRGNVGDPKGNSSQGEGIGENWRTHIPKNQSHDCSSSGVVIVDIVVNSDGSVKRATARAANDPCLSKTAKALVLKYVTAHPGKDGRRGSYRVNLR